jgi:hypothetical protein
VIGVARLRRLGSIAGQQSPIRYLCPSIKITVAFSRHADLAAPHVNATFPVPLMLAIAAQ